ncbi:MAG: acetylglutamate kinase [Polyangiales bacterium]
MTPGAIETPAKTAPSRMRAPVVVKLGGEVVHSEFLTAIAADIAVLARDHAVVVVHGGGPQASSLQKRLGQRPHIIAGRRVTDRDALDVMKMAVAGWVNVDLCSALLAAGGHPVGLHGASDCVIRAVKRPARVVAGGGPHPIDFGHVGDVVSVNVDLIALLIESARVPVIACLGAADDGAIFNINADIVANRIAIELGATALVLVSDVRGVMRDVADPSSRIARLSIEEGRQAIASGVVTKGMIPKLEESFAAIEEGVRAIHIVGQLVKGELAREVAAPGSVGTALTR